MEGAEVVGRGVEVVGGGVEKAEVVGRGVAYEARKVPQIVNHSIVTHTCIISMIASM